MSSSHSIHRMFVVNVVIDGCNIHLIEFLINLAVGVCYINIALFASKRYDVEKSCYRFEQGGSMPRIEMNSSLYISTI